MYRRLLLIGYRTGLQAWDTTNLGSVSEVLNLRGAAWGDVVSAGVLPTPLPGARDEFEGQRPLLGIV